MKCRITRALIDKKNPFKFSNITLVYGVFGWAWKNLFIEFYEHKY